MSRKYRIVAEVEGNPEVNDPLYAGSAVWDGHSERGYHGSITEVTAIMSAEDALAEIDKILDRDPTDANSMQLVSIHDVIEHYRASQEKPGWKEPKPECR